ncbi:unnamed protein product [Brassica oleracea]
MGSIQLPTPIILVCPSLRYKCSSRTNYDRHAKFKIVDSPHYYPFAVPESSLPYSYFGHRLNPLYWRCQDKLLLKMTAAAAAGGDDDDDDNDDDDDEKINRPLCYRHCKGSFFRGDFDVTDPQIRSFPSTYTQILKFMKLSSQFIDKFTRVSTLPAHHTDLIKKVLILKDELLSMVLDQKGHFLLTSYRDGAGIVELMDQLFSLPYLALQVLEWRRRQLDWCIPLTSEEYAKGIKIAGRARDISFAVSLFNEAGKKRSQTAPIYNALMSAYMYNGLAEECQSVFIDFIRQTHCAPTVGTYNILISVYGRLLMVKNMETKAFEEKRKRKLSLSSSTYNCLLAGYVTAWEWDKMEATFREIKTGSLSKM